MVEYNKGIGYIILMYIYVMYAPSLAKSNGPRVGLSAPRKFVHTIIISSCFYYNIQKWAYIIIWQRVCCIGRVRLSPLFVDGQISIYYYLHTAGYLTQRRDGPSFRAGGPRVRPFHPLIDASNCIIILIIQIQILINSCCKLHSIYFGW